MKLISCYIEQFGGLSRYALDFEEGLTVIQEPNGFGKTTLAEFIRAMFYGFPRKKGELGRRQKYLPWSGAKCAGHLTFELDGERYRIERTFGAKPQQDTFRLVDLQTGKISKRFGKEIGLELFGLDGDSFERSTYLPQNRDVGPLTTDSIQAKLGDLVEDTGDVGNFEKALAALRAKRSAYRHFTGTGGAVGEATAQITRIQQELDRAAGKEQELIDVVQSLDEEERRRGGIQQQIEAVREELRVTDRAETCLAHQQHHRRMAEALNRTRGELAALEARYPAGFPDAQAMQAISEGVDRAEKLADQPAEQPEDARARQLVQAHQDRFAAGVPTEETFTQMHRTWDQSRQLTAQLDACALPEAEAAELAELETFFEPGRPDGQVLHRWQTDLDEAGRLRQEAQRLAARTVAEPQYKVPSPLTVPLLLVCGIGAVLVGIVMLARSNFAPGGIALGVGVLALLGAAYLSLRAAVTRQVPAISPQVQQIMRENEARAAGLEQAVREAMGAYAQISPAELGRRLERLAQLEKREADLRRSRRDLTARRDQCDGTLRAFFQQYRCAMGSDPYDALNRLQRVCDAWTRACEQLEDLARREAERSLEQAALWQIFRDFREAYGFAPESREQVLALRDDIRRAAELKDAIGSQEESLAAYVRENGAFLDGAVPEIRTDSAALRRREAQLLAEQDRSGGMLLELAQRQRLLQEQAARIPELQDELTAWQEKKLADQQRAELLDDTMAFLTRARENLATAYMGPIRERFATLMERMNGESREKILMTPELEVRLEREGAGRELAYFSAGQMDLVMLCMRLALVDALFRQTKPFVILDDPFVNLDDSHTAQALALLRELARDRQILYLVCNSSRV